LISPLDTGGRQTGRGASDTGTQDAAFHSGSVETPHAHDLVASINAATGLAATAIYDDLGSTDTQTADLTEGTTDVKAATGSETLSGGFDDDESDVEADHVQVSLHTVGTDSLGRILDTTETATQDDTVTDHKSNNDQLAADGSDVDALDDAKSATGTVTDTLTGTMITINADGTRTTVTFNDTLADSSDAHSDDGDTANTTAAGVTTDTPVHTIDGTGDLGWGIDETIVVTDATGAVVSSGADIDSGGDTEQVQQASSAAAVQYAAAAKPAAAQKTEPPGGYESVWGAAIFGFFHGFVVTGPKAIVNQGTKSLAGAVSAGRWEPDDLIAVDPVTDIGYGDACIPARASWEIGTSLTPAALANVGRIGTAMKLLDKANNIVGAAQGAGDIVVGMNNIRQNGLNVQDGAQVLAGSLAAAGGVAEVRNVANGAKVIKPKVVAPQPPAKIPAAGSPVAVGQKTSLVPSAPAQLGKWGEARLALDLAEKGEKPAKAFKTTLGKRYVDRLVDGIAHEAKAGINVQLTSSIKTQVLKDAELIATGQLDGAVWHFYQGASQELLDFLTANGIQYVVH
jgi:hypothetical protein